MSPVSSSVKLLKIKIRKGPFPAAVCKTGILTLRVGVSGICQGKRVSYSSLGICSSWCLALLSFPSWLLLSVDGCGWLRSEQRGGGGARHGSAGLLKRVHFQLSIFRSGCEAVTFNPCSLFRFFLLKLLLCFCLLNQKPPSRRETRPSP